LAHVGGGFAAERGDLLHQPRGVLQLVPRVLAHPVGVGLILEADHAPRRERVEEHGAVLEAQSRVEVLDLRIDIHPLFGGHAVLLTPGRRLDSSAAA
jgi:hypothetical protein